MKKKFIYLIIPIITVILESLPYGVVLLLWNGEEFCRETFSYFDRTPIEFLDIEPIITTVLTCISLILLIIYCFKSKEKLAVLAKTLLCVCAINEAGPLCQSLFVDMRVFSVVRLMVFILLIAEILLLHFKS